MVSDVQLQPLVLEPYGWAGNDGNWSTFRIEVGNPPQPFQILPSTCSNEVWIPTPPGCKVPVANCTDSRGVLSTSGSSSRGFQSNISDTWQLINILDLGSEDHYFSGQEGGFYGLDTLSVGKDPATTLSNQIVAGIATSNFWLGILGLGNIPAKVTTSDGLVPSFVTSLKNNKITQSLSYGYGAGAAYRKPCSHLPLTTKPRVTSTYRLIPRQPDHRWIRPSSFCFQLCATQYHCGRTTFPSHLAPEPRHNQHAHWNNLSINLRGWSPDGDRLDRLSALVAGVNV